MVEQSLSPAGQKCLFYMFKTLLFPTSMSIWSIFPSRILIRLLHWNKFRKMKFNVVKGLSCYLGVQQTDKCRLELVGHRQPLWKELWSLVGPVIQQCNKATLRQQLVKQTGAWLDKMWPWLQTLPVSHYCPDHPPWVAVLWSCHRQAQLHVGHAPDMPVLGGGAPNNKNVIPRLTAFAIEKAGATLEDINRIRHSR